MKIGVVCRFKPLHLVHAALLKALCQAGDEVLIGIGSSNRYDLRNPFTAGETADMIHAALEGQATHYRLIEVPDLGHGPRWRAMVERLMGELDLFVSANDYVRGLMESVYPLAHPLDLLAEGDRAPIDGTRVRRAMARGDDWEALVPASTRDYLVANDLPERFRREFGLATLLDEMGPAPAGLPDTMEVKHVRMG
jgi:nicotinamide-nucleotide adenylyltransferase